MRLFRTAVATRCSGRQNLRESLKWAAECGADGVQFDLRDELRPADFTDTGRRQLLNFLGELTLRVGSATFPLRRPLADEQGLETRLAALRAAMDFAYPLGARVLTLRVGKLPPVDQPEARSLLTELLSDLARHANHVGVSLAITPADESPRQLADFLANIRTGPIGIDFDPAAFLIGGHLPETEFRDVHGLILHVAGRDAVRDVDGGIEVALGRGEVDWTQLLPLLHEAEYSGWITVLRNQGDDRAHDVARAVTYLERVLW